MLLLRAMSILQFGESLAQIPVDNDHFSWTATAVVERGGSSQNPQLGPAAECHARAGSPVGLFAGDDGSSRADAEMACRILVFFQ